MSIITLNVDITLGTGIKEACHEAVELASKLNVCIEFKFNGVTCLALPNGNPDNLVENWDAELRNKKSIKIATTN